jgi:hypothetical protein
MMRTTQGAERLAEQMENVRRRAAEGPLDGELARVVTHLATVLRDHFRSQVRVPEKSAAQLELRNHNGEFVALFPRAEGEEYPPAALLGERLFCWDEAQGCHAETTPVVLVPK